MNCYTYCEHNINGSCRKETILSDKEACLNRNKAPNYAEEQLQHAIEKENLENIIERLQAEKDCLFVIKEKALEELHEYKLANISLGDFRQKLEDDISKLKSYISELEYQSMEQAKIENNLKEQINNTDRYVKSCEIYVKNEKENNERLQREVEELKQVVKDLANLL